MNVQTFLRRWTLPFAAIGLIALMLAPTAAAHESRQEGEYRVTVGMIAEPVYVGQKSGLEFRVVKGDGEGEDDTPIEGLEETITAQAVKGGVTKDLEVAARFGEPGWYQSWFFPTESGPYEFRLSGTIEGVPYEGTWIAGQPGEGAQGQYGPVQELAGGQFPQVLPSDAQVAANAETGKTAPIALAIAIVGGILGIVAIGLVLATRRRSA